LLNVKKMSGCLTIYEFVKNGFEGKSSARDKLRIWEREKVVQITNEGVQKETHWRLLEHSDSGWKSLHRKIQKW
jgi:hypothetical protein